MPMSLTVIATAALTASPVMALASPAVTPPPRPPIAVCAPGTPISADGLAPEDSALLVRACASTDRRDAGAALPPMRIEGPSGRLASSDDDEPESGDQESGGDESGGDESGGDESGGDENSGDAGDDSSSGGSSGNEGNETSGDETSGDDSSGDDSSGDENSDDESSGDDSSDVDSSGGNSTGGDSTGGGSGSDASTGGTSAPAPATGGQDRDELAAIADGLAALLAESGNPRSVELAERLSALDVTSGGASGGTASGAEAATGGNTDRAGGNRTADSPADLLDVSAWKLTLPGGQEGDPTEILSPDLKGFAEDGVFHMSPDRDGVVFRAEVGGATTKNSDYPRSELREMADAEQEAAWSNTSGTHTLDVRQAITEVPPVKPHVVAAQIHDGNDDVLQIRLEDTKLAVQFNDGQDNIVIDPHYQLGTPYDLRITAADSRVVVHYNGEQAAELPLSGSNWYWKVGAYTQSNPEKGDKSGAAGEVVVYDLAIDHGGAG
jgi:hypothetical protein